MGKVYACSDLHGMYELWKQIENHLQEDDKLIFLGDAADRGSDGIQIMAELLADPRATYLKGNHEDMMVRVCSEYLEGISYNVPLWMQNGGNQTLEDFLKFPEHYQLLLLSKLAALPLVAMYENKNGQKIHLSHAGGKMRDIVLEVDEDLDFLWDRFHFFEYFEPNSPSCDENLYIVHGHTPTQILNKKIGGTYSDNEIRVYCDGHKIDIDTGCFASKQIALLNLDTLEPVYFRLEEGPDGVSR